MAVNGICALLKFPSKPNFEKYFFIKYEKEIIKKSTFFQKPDNNLNLSFQQGIFLEALKTARVTPICKLEVHQLDSNYRPIFFLSVFSKLHEKRVYSCLYAFLAKYKLLFEKQFGFRNNLSTNYAIISLIDLIDKDYFVCGLFINYQKPIDTVNHEIILIKLAFYGIRGLSDS